MAQSSGSSFTKRVASILAGLALLLTVGAVTPAAASGKEDAGQEDADFVSDDGRYVKVGEVEISTTGVISRASLDD